MKGPNGAKSDGRNEKHHVAVFVTLGLAHANHHSARVYVADFEIQRFAYAQTCTVAQREDGSILDILDGRQKLSSLLAAQNYWELLLLAWERNVGDRPVTTEGFAIQEAQGTDGLVVSAPRALLFFDEVELILANVLGPELFGRALEISSEMGDTLDIGLKRPLGVVAQTEVFEIPLT